MSFTLLGELYLPTYLPPFRFFFNVYCQHLRVGPYLHIFCVFFIALSADFSSPKPGASNELIGEAGSAVVHLHFLELLYIVYFKIVLCLESTSETKCRHLRESKGVVMTLQSALSRPTIRIILEHYLRHSKYENWF